MSIIKVGQRVLTVEDPNDSADDWTAEAAVSRKWGEVGEVIATHDSHGLTFEVKHNDGSVGHYEHHELRAVLPRTAVPSERDFCKAALEAIGDYEDSEDVTLDVTTEQWVEIVKTIYAQVFPE
jgi:hypothetical protein